MKQKTKILNFNKDIQDFIKNSTKKHNLGYYIKGLKIFNFFIFKFILQ